MYKGLVVLLIGVCLPVNMGHTVEELKSLSKQIHETCVAKIGVSEDLIDAVNKDKTFSDDESLKCYTKCIMQELGLMDDEGIVDVEAAVDMIPDDCKEELEPLIRDCDTKKGSNPCETAWLTQKCYSQFSKYHLI